VGRDEGGDVGGDAGSDTDTDLDWIAIPAGAFMMSLLHEPTTVHAEEQPSTRDGSAFVPASRAVLAPIRSTAISGVPPRRG